MGSTSPLALTFDTLERDGVESDGDGDGGGGGDGDGGGGSVPSHEQQQPEAAVQAGAQPAPRSTGGSRELPAAGTHATEMLADGVREFGE